MARGVSAETPICHSRHYLATIVNITYFCIKRAYWERMVQHPCWLRRIYAILSGSMTRQEQNRGIFSTPISRRWRRQIVPNSSLPSTEVFGVKMIRLKERVIFRAYFDKTSKCLAGFNKTLNIRYYPQHSKLFKSSKRGTCQPVNTTLSARSTPFKYLLKPIARSKLFLFWHSVVC